MWAFINFCSALFEILKSDGRYLFRSGSKPMVNVKIGDLAAGKMTTKKITMRRYETDKYGTRSILTMPSGSQYYVLEPSPKAANPCIKEWSGLIEWLDHPEHGHCYELKDVPGHTAILFHKGNFAGDPAYGLKTDSLGCFLPGRAIGELWNREGGNQLAVLSSDDALRAIVAELEKEPAYLTVEWSRDVPKENYA